MNPLRWLLSLGVVVLASGCGESPAAREQLIKSKLETGQGWANPSYRNTRWVDGTTLCGEVARAGSTDYVQFGGIYHPSFINSPEYGTAVVNDNEAAFSQREITQCKFAKVQSKADTDREAREAKKYAQEQLAIFGGEALKKAMRNPDSFKVSKAMVTDETGAVCYEYRAQNGFGGINVERAVLTSIGEFLTENMNGFTTLWDKHCEKRTGVDYAHAIR